MGEHYGLEAAMFTSGCSRRGAHVGVFTCPRETDLTVFAWSLPTLGKVLTARTSPEPRDPVGSPPPASFHCDHPWEGKP